MALFVSAYSTCWLAFHIKYVGLHWQELRPCSWLLSYPCNANILFSCKSLNKLPRLTSFFSCTILSMFTVELCYIPIHFFSACTWQPMNLKISCHVTMKFWMTCTSGGFLQWGACLHCCGSASRQTWDPIWWRGGWKEARLCCRGTTDSLGRQLRRYGALMQFNPTTTRNKFIAAFTKFQLNQFSIKYFIWILS